jgi:eukaryotic-like serine/threonine-protein kinase
MRVGCGLPVTTEPDHDAEEWDDEAPTRITNPFEGGSFFGERFQITRELAVGGMGSVYEALDLHTQKPVALKVMKKDRKASEEAVQRFHREAEILASMDHPGIVRIRGFGHASDGRPWLAMELLEGETLLDKVRREGPLPVEAVATVVRATCDALEAAHRRGVVHRDLKPENIFLPAAGESPVKVLDFGLSQMAGGAKLTRTGAILGTPRYMAPEQIRSARDADARVDVYALGIIAYEALAGSSPFTASDHGQLLGAILTGRRRPLKEVRPDLQAAVEEVLSGALAPNPDERFASAAELAGAFDAAVGRAAPRAGDRSFAAEEGTVPTLVQRLSSPPRFTPAEPPRRPAGGEGPAPSAAADRGVGSGRLRPAVMAAVAVGAGVALGAAAWVAVQALGM